MTKLRSSAPLVVVLGVLLAALTAPAFGMGTPPFDRTIIVNGGNTDLVNGTNLINAVNTASSLASATDPWLVKVEPGIFDLGGATLQMHDFVDIEGSGRNATFIRSSAAVGGSGLAATINVAASVDAELRNLTVQSFASSFATGITNFSSELKLTTVNIEVESGNAAFGFATFDSNPRLSAVFPRVSSTGNNDATGVFIDGGGPIINEMFVFINNPTPGDNRGFRIESGANPVVEQVSGVVFGGTRNTGILVQGASARITNNRWTTTGGSLSRGLYLTDDTFVEVQESTFEATGGSTSVGIQNDTGFLTLQTSRVFTGTGSASIAVENVFSGFTDIDQSVLQGNTSIQNTFGGSFRVGSTQLSGTRAVPGPGSAVCAASYDGGYVAIGPGC